MKNKVKSLIYAVSVMSMAVPALVSAQFEQPAGTLLPNQTVFQIITNIMNVLLAAVGVIGVIGFAIAGILYLTAAGDEGRIGTAKNAMMYSIIGVVVALAGLVALSFAENLLIGTDRF